MKILFLGDSKVSRICSHFLLHELAVGDSIFEPRSEQYDFNDPTPYDLLISVHGRQIVPKSFLDRLPLGGINLHPCLYGYKGKNPIRRAIEAGETKFSVGAHCMTEKVDEGEVLVEKFIEIPRTGELLYTEAEIYNRLYPLYIEVLSEVLRSLQSR